MLVGVNGTEREVKDQRKLGRRRRGGGIAVGSLPENHLVDWARNVTAS